MKTINNKKKVKKYEELCANDLETVMIKLTGKRKIDDIYFDMYEYVRNNIDSINLENKIEVKFCESYLKFLFNKEEVSNQEKKWVLKYLTLKLSKNYATDFEMRCVNTIILGKNAFLVNDIKKVSKWLANALGFQTEKINKDETDYDYQININLNKIKKYAIDDMAPLETVLVTFYHEFTHLRQKQDLGLDVPNYFNSLIAKEYLTINQELYVHNYDDLLYEIEAEMNGYSAMREVYKKYNNKKYKKMVSEIDNIYNLYNARFLVYSLKDNEEYDLGELITSKRADEIILKNPKYMEAYNVLKYEYEKDGTPKTIEKLLKEEKKHKKIYKKTYKENKKLFDETTDFYNNVIWARLIKLEINYDDLYKNISEKGFLRIERALACKIKELNNRDKVNNMVADCSQDVGYELLKNSMVIDKNKIKTYELLKMFKDYQESIALEVSNPKVKK